MKGRLGACVLALAAVLAAAGERPSGLPAAKAEPNLEKRSKLALDNAEAALKQARAAYQKGMLPATEAQIQEMRESVELADNALQQTGKNPRKSPKWFKRAEIETRDLLRKLGSFEQEMSVMDRPLVEPAKAKIQQVHDNLLLGIMEGRRK